MSNYTTSHILRFTLLILLTMAGHELAGQTKTWTNGNGTGLWEDGLNWNPTGAPTATSRVVFDNSNTANCSINSNPTIERLTIESTYTGNVNLGAHNLTIAGNLTVANAATFTSGLNSKVAITAPSRIDCAASLYDLEINTAAAGNRVRIDQVLNISRDLTITQVGSLTRSDIRVGRNITVTDPDLSNSATISAMGNGTLSGTQMRRLKVEAGASLQLASDFILNNNFTLSGAGSISGSNTLILGSNGTVDFSGTASNVEIKTLDATQNVSLSQPFILTGNLKITQMGNLTGSSELRVGGNLTVNDPDVDGSSFVVATGNGNLSGSGALSKFRVEGSASLQLTSDFTLANGFTFEGSGTISGANKLIFASNGTINFSGSVPNVQVSTATSNQSVTLSQNFNIAGGLTITQISNLNGTNLEVRVGGNITVTDAGISGSATLVMAGSGNSSFQGTGGGNYRRLRIDKASSSNRALLNSSDTFLSITVSKGVLDLNSKSVSGPITVEANGTLGGSGTVNGNVLCNAGGFVSPGNSPGKLTIIGNLTVNGTLQMEITGQGDGGGGIGVPGIDFDQIIVTGIATIANLNVIFQGTLSLSPPTFPTSGHLYTLITGTVSISSSSISPASVNGTFILGLLLIGSPAFPIELTHFSGAAEGKAIRLSWATATEFNNDYMAVERSADGIKFSEIGRVKGAGTTQAPQSYFLIDDVPMPGLNYYRLRQVDFDGAFEFHKTISVPFERKGGALNVVAFPNPAQASLQLRWASDSRQATMLRLFGPGGQLLATFQALPGAGNFEIPLDGLPAGLYFLQASQGQEVEVLGFFKQ